MLFDPGDESKLIHREDVPSQLSSVAAGLVLPQIGTRALLSSAYLFLIALLCISLWLSSSINMCLLNRGRMFGNAGAPQVSRSLER